MSPGYVQQGVGYCVLLDSPGADSAVTSSFSHPHDVVFLDTRWNTTARYSGWLGLTSMSSALIIFFSMSICQLVLFLLFCWKTAKSVELREAKISFVCPDGEAVLDAQELFETTKRRKSSYS